MESRGYGVTRLWGHEAMEARDCGVTRRRIQCELPTARDWGHEAALRWAPLSRVEKI
jgi:hypothetical protein